MGEAPQKGLSRNAQRRIERIRAETRIYMREARKLRREIAAAALKAEQQEAIEHEELIGIEANDA